MAEIQGDAKYLEAINTETGEKMLLRLVDETALHSDKLANNLITTEEGYALDARAGKSLSDSVIALNNDLTYTNYFYKNCLSIYSTKSSAHCFITRQQLNLTGGSTSDNIIELPDNVRFLLDFSVPCVIYSSSWVPAAYGCVDILKNGGYIRARSNIKQTNAICYAHFSLPVKYISIT